MPLKVIVGKYDNLHKEDGGDLLQRQNINVICLVRF